MFNYKTKIIVSVTALLLTVILIFALRKEKDGVKENDGTEKVKIEELKKYYPAINVKHLEFYVRIAEKEEIKSCLGREDEKECVAAVAFIKGDKDLCYFHESNHESHKEDKHDEEEKMLKKCVGDILKITASAEIAQCEKLDDDFFNCLKNLFNIYGEKNNCANLSDNETEAICEALFDYEDAYFQYDRQLCAEIKNDKLRTYCLKNIIDKSQDTDGDGLTDLDEINKYKTHYLYKDTDGDGISDFEEVKKADL